MPTEKRNWQIKKTTVVLIAAVVFVILATILLPNRDIWPLFAADEGMMNEVEGYWWAPNGGWIDMDWDDVNDQDVQIDKSTIPRALFTGFAWGPNIGWISMADTSGEHQYQVRIRENVDLKGPGPWPIDNYAWGPNIGWVDFDAIDAWSHPQGQEWPGGPISADEPQIKVDATIPEDADMAGYAWSPNIGWIDLSLAAVPGWRDTTAPVLQYFYVLPENGFPLPPAEKYAGGVYLDMYDYQTAYLNFPGGGQHFAWVKSGIDFKVIMHSVDTRERWHSLNISELAQNDAPPPDEYFWWDRIRFRPGETPNYTGYPMAYDSDSGFNPNNDYADGTNPAAIDPVPDGSTWKSVTHLTTSDPIGGVVAREFRYNLRDAAGNRACSPAATFSWQDGQGCVIPSLPDESPMFGRAGVAIDNVVPSGTLAIGDTEISIVPGDPTPVSKMAGIDFTATYIDTDSGAYHVILDYSRLLGGMWEPWGDEHQIGERHYNIGRETEVWTIDDPANPDPGAEENPLDTSGWADQQVFQLRLRIFDNVGNLRERIFYAKVNDTPPEGDFTAYDPIDRDPSRTRYAATDLYLPASSTIKKMQFANTPDGFGSLFETYPEAGGWKDDWDLSIGGADVTGGIKMVYANFCDGTAPVAVCTRDKGVVVTAQIAAPWFEGAQGDVYGGSGVGTRSLQFEGIAPYYTIGVQKYNATYRITSGGEIKPQITSAQGWTESDYYDFGYPGALSTIAPINFEELKTEAITLYDDDKTLVKDGKLDFTDSPIILLQTKQLDSDPTLRTEKDRLTIIGTGTLLVDGNLRIETDLYYQDELDQNDFTIDSLAVLTNRNNSARRGNVYVSQNVSHIVGAYIIGLGDGSVYPSDELGSGTFHSSVVFSSGSDAPVLTPTGQELVVEGMVAARDFNLGRYSTGNQNFSQNSSFEGNQVGNCVENWTCTGSPGVMFTRKKGSGDPPVVFGDWELQIKVPAGPNPTGSVTQFIDIPSGQNQITASFYLRTAGSELAIPGPVKIRIDNNLCTPTQPAGINVDHQWRRFQCSKDVSPGRHSVSLAVSGVAGLLGGYILEVDGAQFEGASEATEWHLQFDSADTNYMAAERFYYDGRVVISTPPGLASTSNAIWEEGVAD